MRFLPGASGLKEASFSPGSRHIGRGGGRKGSTISAGFLVSAKP
jgi:hypothetical protein